MNWLRSYWHWLALVGVILVLANSQNLPWPLVVALLGAAAAYLLRHGWLVWVRAGGPPSRAKVTYWRGQRIETGPQRGGPALPDVRHIGPALIYLFFGGVLALVAGAIALQNLGR